MACDASNDGMYIHERLIYQYIYVWWQWMQLILVHTYNILMRREERESGSQGVASSSRQRRKRHLSSRQNHSMKPKRYRHVSPFMDKCPLSIAMVTHSLDHIPEARCYLSCTRCSNTGCSIFEHLSKLINID